MITKEFLEEYSLFHQLKYEESFSYNINTWDKTPINMKCHICNSIQTFKMVNEYGHDGYDNWNDNGKNRVLDIRYQCTSCNSFERRFFIHVNKTLDTIYKVGQYPEWEIKMDKNLEKTLNQHAKTFRKGLVCESQGYGIGAFAYYRRITETVIDELLDSITDLIEVENKDNYIKALELTKKTRVTQEKIDLIKDLLPSILKPNGVNPLGVLHSELSEGIHAESDKDCLENAGHIKDILVFLINQIIQSKVASKQFTNSMKTILDKKAKK
ncbi:hypothetical protein ACFLSE_09155 [Bacteroidota bacterium]